MIHPKTKLILWRITQIGEQHCLEHIQGGDDSAWLVGNRHPTLFVENELVMT